MFFKLKICVCSVFDSLSAYDLTIGGGFIIQRIFSNTGTFETAALNSSLKNQLNRDSHSVTLLLDKWRGSLSQYMPNKWT